MSRNALRAQVSPFPVKRDLNIGMTSSFHPDVPQHGQDICLEPEGFGSVIERAFGGASPERDRERQVCQGEIRQQELWRDHSRPGLWRDEGDQGKLGFQCYGSHWQAAK